MHIMDMKNISEGYNPPIVKIVSFMVEQGFAGSEVKVGVANPPMTNGTQCFDSQDPWSVDWHQSAQ